MQKKKILLVLFITISFFLKAQEKESFEVRLDSIGMKIDETLTNLNKEYLNKIYSKKSLCDRFLIESNNKKVKNFNKSFYEGFTASFDFGNIVLKEIEKDASYDYLNIVKDKEGEYYLLFRLYGNGLNYHKHLIKEIDGEIRIVDTYVSLTGEYLSDTFGSIYKGVLYKGGFLKSLSKGSNNDSMHDLLKIQKIRNLRSEGKLQEAHDLYKTLSEEGKKKKIYQLSNLLILANLDEAKYAKAIETYEKQFPNDVSLYLVSIDGYILGKKYDEALKAVDNLDKAIGGDSFLNFIRGNIYFLKLEYKKSEDKFKEVLEEYPNFIDAYDSLLSIYIESNNVKKAIEVLDIMVNDFELPKDILFNSIGENYPEFQKNKEIIKWSK
ncbi:MULTISPECIES: tetratricopeptide repeat protein [unclassified Tenacibaculum]|uniref:tetratricopeptide repeat protein n=1 Tax=unclassified Tenacibaculum TaxID=2635139 RepID=UPI001F39FF6A|nr:MULTISPECIES: hypothetical protein [unclassified Tenacibaculum]MCF2873869.1 hypothetical protein [Tenacibaculum sp. Cn5-1]MCF2936679.1 hypothetical protein [Tenacibaculum sp. Cn5-34]MCG7512903.1 hypothetical protein [Tenacibaculum sp. Cn5-46]